MGRAFRLDVVEEKYIDGLAEAASEVGDVRICFNILRTAGLLAECEGKAKLEREHFLNAAKTIKHANLIIMSFVCKTQMRARKSFVYTKGSNYEYMTKEVK